MPISPTIEAHLESEGAPWPHCEVRRVEGTESVGALFSFAVEIVLASGHPLPDAAEVGAQVTLVFAVSPQPARSIHGIVAEVREQLDEVMNRRSAIVTIAPRASRLAVVETQDVYLDASVTDVIRQKLSLNDFSNSDFELRLVGTYPKRELVVQYGESDLAFLSRLAEHEGIGFFFEHDGGVDKLVFSDSMSGYGELDEGSELPYFAGGQELGLSALEVRRRPIPSGYYLQDYNYRTPQVAPVGRYEVATEANGGVVEFGSHARTPEEATALARIRYEERACRKVVYTATSTMPHVTAGKSFEVVGCALLEGDTRVFVSRVRHELELSDSAQGQVAYHATLEATRSDVAYRPIRSTPRPRMPSVVTGIVRAPLGLGSADNAQLLQEGRYMVQLHFDTIDQQHHYAQHPVRMAQPLGGLGNGMHFPLVPGTEVAIAFVNGDPDRPIILGALPNPLSPSPVQANEPHVNRIQTAAGIKIEFGPA
jgi:type VI secretion system secreted protein VgrG